MSHIPSPPKPPSPATPPARRLCWSLALALAACLIHDPQLLLLDEPTAGVDPKARRDFWDEIRRLSKAGVTVLVSRTMDGR